MSKLKRVYSFGKKSAEGKADMKNLLGGKGANLAEMCLLGLPVPAGFTITTEACVEYYQNNCVLHPDLMPEVWAAMTKTEETMNMKYGDPENALLVSCRSGARSSMPGMMDTVLNIGLCSATIPGFLKKTNNPRFVWDSYRRLIMMYADVVMEKAEGIEPADGKSIRKQLDEMLDAFKKKKGYKSDTEITADELKLLSEEFKKRVKEVLLGNHSRMMPRPSLKAESRPFSRAGMAKRLYPTAASKVFLMTGEQLLTFRLWYSETWVTPLQQALHLRVILLPVKTFSMANGL